MYNYNPQQYQQQAYGGGYPQQPQYNPMASLGSIPPAAIPSMGAPGMGGPPMGGGMQGYNPMGGMGGPQMGGMPGGQMGSMGGMGAPGMGGMPGGQNQFNPMGGMGGPQMGGMPGGQMGSMGGQNNAWYAQYYNQLQQQELNQLRQWFQSVDADRSGHINASELQRVTFGGYPLGLENAIKLVKVFDKDKSGSIDFFEYASMHQFITLMQRAFAQADRDRSGSLDCREIHNALGASGFQIGFAPTQSLFTKVSKGTPTITFTQFLQLGADIAMLKSKFEWADTDRDGIIHINFAQLLEVCADL